MKFGSSNSKKQEENVFENMKILETTVESLNQQIKNNLNSSSSINPVIEEKLNTNFNGLATINNKVNVMDRNLSSKIDNISKKLNEIDKKHNEDLISLDRYMQKNTAIIELLKTTVDLLEDTVDMIKDEKEN